ncbi:MAG: hypothetical protein ABSB82_17075 [Terriglobia bacterium]|jgi:hypothetical protein
MSENFTKDDGRPVRPKYQQWDEPAFQAERRVQRMTPRQRAMYRTMLQAAFHEPTRPYLPADDGELWMIADADSLEQWERDKGPVLAMFKAETVDGREVLSQGRLLEDWRRLLEERDRYAVMGRKSGESRRSSSAHAEPELNAGSTQVEQAEQSRAESSKAESREEQISPAAEQSSSEEGRGEGSAATAAAAATAGGSASLSAIQSNPKPPATASASAPRQPVPGSPSSPDSSRPVKVPPVPPVAPAYDSVGLARRFAEALGIAPAKAHVRDCAEMADYLGGGVDGALELDARIAFLRRGRWHEKLLRDGVKHPMLMFKRMVMGTDSLHDDFEADWEKYTRLPDPTSPGDLEDVEDFS